MFLTPQNEFELVSKKIKQIAEFGTARNTKKLIYWRVTAHNDGRKFITAYQLGGAKINLVVCPSINNLNSLEDFSHDGKFQRSVDLLATILAHKGAYQRLTA